MRGIALFILALGLVSVFLMDATRAAPPPATQPDLATENEQLKDKVARLELKVSVLEHELHMAKQNAALLLKVPQANAPLSLTPAPAVPQMPPGSIQRQFNGVPYYIVPLDQANPGVTPARQR